MAEQEHHEMVLQMVHPSEVEEWYCPTCGRRILMRWPPAYNKVVLEAGDETAIHSGGKGGLRMGPIQIHTNNESISEMDDLIPLEAATLQPWIDWMEQVDFEAFWDWTKEE